MSIKQFVVTATLGATGTTAVAAPVLGDQWTRSVDARVKEIRDQAEKASLENSQLKKKNAGLRKDKNEAVQAKIRAEKERKTAQDKFKELESEFNTKVVAMVEEELRDPVSVQRGDKQALFLKLKSRVQEASSEPLTIGQKGWTCRNTTWKDERGESRGIAYCIKEEKE